MKIIGLNLTIVFCTLHLVIGNLFEDVYYGVISIYEMCDKKWIPNNIEGLKQDLDDYVFGQPFIKNLILPALALHVSDKYQPQKPLVFSFHGWPGTGKNYVTDFIAQNLFKKGLKSSYRKFYSGRLHFPFEREVDHYKVRLKSEIEDQISSCGQSLFIFDEIDKVPEGLFDIIKPYLDYNVHLNGKDYRRSIFIFLSNTGSQQIIEESEKLNLKGYKKLEYPYKNFEIHLRNWAYNEGGLKKSNIVKNHLVDYYVPFLPLDREDVTKCIKHEVELQEGEFSQALLNSVLDELYFGPEPNNLYSQTGCKTVMQKVNHHLVRSKWHSEL